MYVIRMYNPRYPCAQLREREASALTTQLCHFQFWPCSYKLHERPNGNLDISSDLHKQFIFQVVQTLETEQGVRR